MANQGSRTALLWLLLLAGWGTAAYYWKQSQVPLPPPATPPPEKHESPVARAFREIVEEPGLAGAQVTFCILDESGKPLFLSEGADGALCPASSLKTLTSGAALEILGPDFTFETALGVSSPVTPDGIVHGDLILIGGGDPTLELADLAKLADEAIASGITEITGAVRVDTSIFPDNPANDHWVWGDVGNGYGAGAFGVNLGHNRVRVQFQPGSEVGAPAAVIRHSPVPAGISWLNYVETAEPGTGDQVVVYSEPYGRRITLRGTVPLGENGFSVSAANPDPPALAAEYLRQRLEAGVRFSNHFGPFLPESAATIATHKSEPLPKIIDHLHQVSDNLETQCLFLMLGVHGEDDPAAVVEGHWREAGVEFEGLRLLDGSGLARANMIRALDLARVMHVARKGKHGERFRESLSTYNGGAVRAKIGGMSGVATQAGYLRTESGRELAFAFMANGLTGGSGAWSHLRSLLDEMRTAVK